MDIAGHIEEQSEQLLAAGREAYDQLGRGALITFPQRDQGDGKTPVTYQPLDLLKADDDPAARIVEVYDPAREVVLIVAVDDPQGIYTYRLSATGVRLAEMEQ